MAKFEEEKVINSLHPEKAVIGKMYFHSDQLKDLKDDVENDGHREKLAEIDTDFNEPFVMELGASFQFLYPYEEPLKQRMTYIQLMEWFSKGNGIWRYRPNPINSIDAKIVYENIFCYCNELDNEVDNIQIRPFGQTEWVEPTYEIYLKDCKGGKE